MSALSPAGRILRRQLEGTLSPPYVCVGLLFQQTFLSHLLEGHGHSVGSSGRHVNPLGQGCDGGRAATLLYHLAVASQSRTGSPQNRHSFSSEA